jgi:KDO2-lipid IV(A) lauroyltransferase
LRKTIKRASLYALVRGLMFTAQVLPRWVSLRFFSTLGVLAFYVLKKERARTEINLALAMPHLSRAELRRLSRDVWALLGRNCVDALRLLGMKWEEMSALVRVEGLRVLEEAVSRGRGVVAVTGHIGNWEMLAAYFSMRGYPLSVLARPLRDPRLERLIDRVRRSKGMRPISRIGNVKAAYEALKNGGVLGVLIDQDTSVKGVFCDFFGRPAFTPSGPAYLAMRTGAAIVPMAISLQRDGTHLVRILEPVQVEATGGHGSRAGSRDTEDSRALAITQSCTRALEELIRLEPAQWVWMHERWKTGP